MSRSLINAMISIAMYAYGMPATAQNSLKNTPSVISCTPAKDVASSDLYGAWSLLLEGGGNSTITRAQLQRNPEFADSLAGSYSVGDKKFEMFGDVEEGAFDMEESANAKDIIAIWKGRVVDGSCGQTVVGTRRNTLDNTEQSFVLRRPGW